MQNTSIETDSTDQRLESLRKVTLFDYALHLASPFTLFLLSLVAVFLNYSKRTDAEGTVYASHMNYMIRTFWWTMLWNIVFFVGFLLTFGLMNFLLAIPTIWYMYRMIRGALRALDGREIA